MYIFLNVVAPIIAVFAVGSIMQKMCPMYVKKLLFAKKLKEDGSSVEFCSLFLIDNFFIAAGTTWHIRQGKTRSAGVCQKLSNIPNRPDIELNNNNKLINRKLDKVISVNEKIILFYFRSCELIWCDYYSKHSEAGCYVRNWRNHCN